MLSGILERWPLKLLAMAIAFAIWLAITGENQIVKDFTVPLDIELNEETILTGGRPTQSNIRLRGPESIIRRIDAFSLAVQVDLTSAAPGEYSVDLHPTDVIGVPADVVVELIDPNRIDLNVTRRLRRLLPVVPDLVGQPAEGFAFYGLNSSPETLEVTGPEVEIARLDRLKTTPIRLEGRSASFSVTVDAVPDSPEIRLVNPRPLEVRVELDQAPVELTYPEVPIVLGGQQYEATVDPSSTEVVLSGPPQILERIRSSQLRCVADISGLQPSPRAYTVPARLELPDLSARDLARISEKLTKPRDVSVRVFDRRIAP